MVTLLIGHEDDDDPSEDEAEEPDGPHPTLPVALTARRTDSYVSMWLNHIKGLKKTGHQDANSAAVPKFNVQTLQCPSTLLKTGNWLYRTTYVQHQPSSPLTILENHVDMTRLKDLRGELEDQVASMITVFYRQRKPINHPYRLVEICAATMQTDLTSIKKG